MTTAELPVRATGTDLRYAWYVVFVLMVCHTLSFIDRQILSLVIGPMKQELGITDTQVGLLGGVAFAIFYTSMGLPIGRLCDRYNRRNIVTAGLILWRLMTALCAYGRSFLSLFLFRVGVGVGEAALGRAALNPSLPTTSRRSVWRPRSASTGWASASGKDWR